MSRDDGFERRTGLNSDVGGLLMRTRRAGRCGDVALVAVRLVARELRDARSEPPDYNQPITNTRHVY